MGSWLGTLGKAPGGAEPAYKGKPATGLMIAAQPVQWHQVSLSGGNCLHTPEMALLLLGQRDLSELVLRRGAPRKTGKLQHWHTPEIRQGCFATETTLHCEWERAQLANGARSSW
jgi:hypothetical protein